DQAGIQSGPVRLQLPGEAVHRPCGRVAADCGWQARMLSDQRGYECPGPQPEQALDVAGSEQGAAAVAFASCPAEGVKLRDQGRDFGGVEKCCDVADDRATRYLARCHRRYLSCGHAPGGTSLAGALLSVFAGETLTRGSDSKPL